MHLFFELMYGLWPTTVLSFLLLRRPLPYLKNANLTVIDVY